MRPVFRTMAHSNWPLTNGRILKQFPKDPLAIKAQHYAGVCHLQLKHFTEAAQHFQAVVTKDPKSSCGRCFDQFGLGANSHWADRAAGHVWQGRPDTDAHSKSIPREKSRTRLCSISVKPYAQGKGRRRSRLTSGCLKDHKKSLCVADAMYALGVSQEETQHMRKPADLRCVCEGVSPERARDRNSDAERETLFIRASWRRPSVIRPVAKQPGFASPITPSFVRQTAPRDRINLSRRVGCTQRRRELSKVGLLADAAIAAGRCFYRADQFEMRKPGCKDHRSAGERSGRGAHWLCRLMLKQREPRKSSSSSKSSCRSGRESLPGSSADGSSRCAV